MAMNRGNKRGGRKAYRGPKAPTRDDFISSLPIHAEGAYSNPTLAHTLTTLIGCVVEVQMQNGVVYEGVLRAISPNMEIALSVAHVKGQSPSSDNVYDRKEISFAEVVTISAKSGSNPQLGIFKTDSEIGSRSNGPQSRELQPFTDFSEDSSGDLSFLGNSMQESGWSVDEMWKVNQSKFKVVSNFDEEMSQYTTQLDRSDSESFKQREIRAERLANEIETKDMFSRHGIDDSGTEEERFSSVVRSNAPVRPPGKPSLSTVQENGRHPVTSTSLPSPTPPPPTVTPPHPLPTSPSASVSETSSKGTSSILHGNHQTTTDASEDKSSTDSADETNEGEKPVIMGNKGVQSPSSLGETVTAVATGDKVQSSAGSQEEPSPDQSQVVAEKESGEEEASKHGERNETAKTEQAIKDFKLDPKAKEFVLNPAASPFIPTSVPTSRTSPSPSSLQSSPSTTYSTHPPSHTHSHAPRSTRYTGHRSPRPRTHTPTHVYTPPAIIPEPMLQTGYVLAQHQAASGLFRPAVIQPGFPQYTVPPNAMVGGMVAQGVLPSPQIISTNPHTQMIAGGGQQQFALGNIAQQAQFLAQPSQQIITPRGVISPAQPTLYMPGVAPHSSLQQQQALATAAAAVPQVPQVNPMGQQIVGTTAASVPQRMMPYQMPGTGK